MHSQFYAEHEVFIASVKKLVDRELRPRVSQWEKDGYFPDEVFSILGKAGFLGILISEEYGGSGGDYHLASAWCETFGALPAVGLTVAVNMHSLIISHALEKYGTTAAKNKWLPKCVSGEAIGAYAFTEPGAGSDLANIITRADWNGTHWILNGPKTFITNGARAHYVLVLARNDLAAGYKGFTTFLVDTSSPGFSVQRKLDKLGWRSSDTAELFLENVAVDESCVLGKVGDGWIQASNNLSWERLMLALTSLAGGRACYEDALRYANDRKAFGKKIIDFEIIHEWFAEMESKLMLGEALAHRCVELVQSGFPCRVEVAVAKRKICDDAVWIADKAIQVLGGYGYTTEFSAERWWRDLRLMPIGGGTSEIMATIVAKELFS